MKIYIFCILIRTHVKLLSSIKLKLICLENVSGHFCSLCFSCEAAADFPTQQETWEHPVEGWRSLLNMNISPLCFQLKPEWRLLESLTSQGSGERLERRLCRKVSDQQMAPHSCCWTLCLERWRFPGSRNPLVWKFSFFSCSLLWVVGSGSYSWLETHWWCWWDKVTQWRGVYFLQRIYWPVFPSIHLSVCDHLDSELTFLRTDSQWLHVFKLSVWFLWN